MTVRIPRIIGPLVVALAIAMGGALTGALVGDLPDGDAASRSRVYVSPAAVKSSQTELVGGVTKAFDAMVAARGGVTSAQFKQIVNAWDKNRTAFVKAEQTYLGKVQTAGMNFLATGPAGLPALRSAVDAATKGMSNKIGGLNKISDVNSLLGQIGYSQVALFQKLFKQQTAFTNGRITQNEFVVDMRGNVKRQVTQIFTGFKPLLARAPFSARPAVQQVLNTGAKKGATKLAAVQTRFLDKLPPPGFTAPVTVTTTVTNTVTVSAPVPQATHTIRCFDPPAAGLDVAFQGVLASGGSGLPGATITFAVTPPSGTAPTVAAQTTDAAGGYNATFTPAAAGTHQLVATYAGDASHGTATASCSVDVP